MVVRILAGYWSDLQEEELISKLRFEERHVETIGVFNTELIFKQERRDIKMTVYLAVPSVLTPQFAALELHHS